MEIQGKKSVFPSDNSIQEVSKLKFNSSSFIQPFLKSVDNFEPFYVFISIFEAHHKKTTRPPSLNFHKKSSIHLDT